MDSNDKFYVQSVHRALSIVDAISRNDNRKMNLSALSKKLQLHPSTVYRLLQNLIDLEYISEDSPGQYCLGMAFLKLGQQVHQSIDLVNIAKKHLLKLNEQTKETVYLAVWDKKANQILYIDKLNGLGNIHLVCSIGTRNLLHCTANGKALMADLDDKAILDVLSRTEMAAKTRFTITDPESFVRQVRSVSLHGYSQDREESEYNVACIAAPIRDYSSGIVASVSVSGMVSDIHHHFQRFASLVMDTAKDISYDLGYRPQTETESR